mgnify:CR=1 FL=1
MIDPENDAAANLIELTEGENLILARIDQLEELINELIEKVNNINLTDSDGLSIERY